jgi:prolyl 4-hydroxylase
VITPSSQEILITNNPSTAEAASSRTFVKKSRRHPSVRDIPGPRTTATSAKFRSLSSRPIQIWYDNGTPEMSFQGELISGQETTTNAYQGHVFFFTEKANKKNVLAKHTISADQVLYLVKDPKHPADRLILEKTEREEKFMADYLNRTGRHWRHHYGLDGPRPPPVLHMWPAQEVGQVHRATSRNGYWTCAGAANKCQSREPISFELEVASLAPKVFIIPQFLNSFEADAVIGIANVTVKASTVGSYDGGGVRTDSTRTSRNTWIPRSKSPLTDTLFRRAADVLNVDESLLHTASNVEDIQVVHYVNGQKYDSHHDWGVSGYHESRYITMLMYLTDQTDPDAGGETSFPKAGTGGGIKVTPVKGDAVLFYNLLEDGNGDDLALHAALPVWRGEKWLANFWVWDRSVA